MSVISFQGDVSRALHSGRIHLRGLPNIPQAAPGVTNCPKEHVHVVRVACSMRRSLNGVGFAEQLSRCRV